MVPSLISPDQHHAMLINLSDIPPKPPRSKLEPHRELIRELRRKGRTYREIASLFVQRVGFYVAPSTIHSFVKVRARHRKAVQFELPAPPSVEAPNASQAVAVLRSKPQVEKSKQPRFVFQESEPLTLTTKGDGR
jgi:hypothetical protein